MSTPTRPLREGRCPDGGYCHGSSLAAGSAPCDPGSCYRVLNAGPLSGVYPGDRWPEQVRSAHGLPAPEPWPAVLTAEDVDPVERWLAASRCCGAPQLCGARCMDDEESATAARVARELDDARGRIVELEGELSGAVTEYRVETRRTPAHPGGPGAWCPEGDHHTFPERGQAEAYLSSRARWYDNPRYWEHRVTARTVTGWEVPA